MKKNGNTKKINKNDAFQPKKQKQTSWDYHRRQKWYKHNRF